MIYLLTRPTINGGALTKLKMRDFDDPQHLNYTLAFIAPIHMADAIREYNILTVTIGEDVGEDMTFFCTGNEQDWQFLVRLLRTSPDKAENILADHICANLPIASLK